MRSRILRPGFFENDELARLPDKARLLFAGLWCLADRAGRLEDRPPRITKKLFPYEDVDVDPLLEALAGAGFISRYAGPDGRRCLHVTKFLVHQSPHVKEVPSTLPPPPDSVKTLSKNSEHQPRLVPSTNPAPTQHQPRSPCTVSVSVSDPVAISDPDSVSNPVSVSDPVQEPDQDQDQPPAADFSDAEEAEPDPAFRVYAAIASAALQELAVERQPDELGTLTARFKQLCAKQGKPYDADIARRAVDAARHARDKAAANFKALFPARPPRDPASDPWQHVAQPPGSAEAAARASAHVKGRRR